MFKNKFIAITVSIFAIVTLAACNLTRAPAAGSASAVPIETQVAEAIASTLAVQTAVASALAPTETAMPTDTPELLYTATLAPTATFTATQYVPPTVVYIPYTATPVATTPPSFSAAYAATVKCSGTYEFKFTITNTGSVTLESNRIKATDSVTNEALIVSHDDFPNENKNCSLINDDQNLAAGDVGHSMSGGFSADPTGHSITAVIHICSQNGENGACVQKSLTFTP